MTVQIKRVTDSSIIDIEDILAIEEPLEIRLSFVENGLRKEKNISVTMRTPGNDDELAVGFLFTEGVITNREQISSIKTTNNNIVTVFLNDEVQFDLAILQRNFYTTSSCGVCGKSSIDAIRTNRKYSTDGNIYFKKSELGKLPSLLESKQEIFQKTGGLHSSALVNSDSEILLIREDVGRHNALDKVIGHQLLSNNIPLSDFLLLLSGRASFELMQKAFMAGISFIAAIGAPSSLAVEFAIEKDMTLIGFLKENRFNIYTGEQRILS